VNQHAQAAGIFQDKRTGKRVRQIGGANHKDETVLVKGNDNVPYYTSLANLIPCDTTGTPDFTHTYERPEEADEPIPEPVVDIIETRLNVNTATAEELAKRVEGLGYRTAKRIKEIQTSLPGEVFRSLDQLKSASTRVNWDAVLEANQLFVG